MVPRTAPESRPYPIHSTMAPPTRASTVITVDSCRSRCSPKAKPMSSAASRSACPTSISEAESGPLCRVRATVTVV